MLRNETIKNHPVIQYLRSALEKNNERAGEGDVLISSSNGTVANDNELKSSLETKSNVTSTHNYSNDSVPPEAPSASLSGSGNSNFHH